MSSVGDPEENRAADQQRFSQHGRQSFQKPFRLIVRVGYGLFQTVSEGFSKSLPHGVANWLAEIHPFNLGRLQLLLS